MIARILANYRIKSILMILFALLCIIALVTYNPSDPSFNLASSSNPTNLLGIFGSYIADILYQTIGVVAFLIPICLLSWGVVVLRKQRVPLYWLRVFSLFCAVILFAISFHKVEVGYLPSNAGGAFGILLFKEISLLTSGNISDYAIIFCSLITAFILLIFTMAINITSYTSVISSIYAIFLSIIRQISKFRLWLSRIREDRNQAKFSRADSMIFSREPIIEKLRMEPRADNQFVQMDQIMPQQTVATTVERGKIQPKSKEVSRTNNQDTLPPVDLLDQDHNQKVAPMTRAELEANSEELIKVLNDFGVKGKILDVRQGPVVTLYEFEPAAGTKSSRVIGLADDIARSLCAVSTRIAVIPGRNALGIELPNKQRMFFRLRELIQTQEFKDERHLLPLILGKELGGAPFVADLAKMPHLLVAGTTGSGKSVGINAMIMSLLYRYRPDECRMIMIDPKMLELSAYDNIPHLLTPVVTEPGKAVVALKWAVKEMENRYRLMSHLGVRNIANYNAKILEAAKEGRVLERTIQTGFDPETGKPIHESVPIDMQKMPYIVVIVDEMADLMLVAGKDIESSIQRLAQMARAAGIHLIMATQRPSVDVITGVIKANFPSRMSFKVTSKIDSRTILGEQGAEQLLGMGDMLFMGNSSRILRVHGPFVDDREVERVTSFLRSTGVPDYIPAVTESADEDIGIYSEGAEMGAGDDGLYRQAVNIVRTERKTSISYIQRSLRIGYNRAANLVEEMEKNGILSAPNHSGKREILLPEE